MKLPQTYVSFVLRGVTEKDLEIEKSNKWLQKNLIDQTVRFEVVSTEHGELSVYLYLNGEIDHINDIIYAMFEKKCNENKRTLLLPKLSQKLSQSSRQQHQNLKKKSKKVTQHRAQESQMKKT